MGSRRTGGTVSDETPARLRVPVGTILGRATELERPWASWFVVSADFFRVAGIDVVAGRGIDATDREGSAPVAVINRMAAERYFDGPADAVGRSVVIHDAARPLAS